MKPLETWALDYLAFATRRDTQQTIVLVRMVREEALSTVAEMARKHGSPEFLEFADKIEALKSLP